jgi:hypothetical protein
MKQLDCLRRGGGGKMEKEITIQKIEGKPVKLILGYPEHRLNMIAMDGQVYPCYIMDDKATRDEFALAWDSLSAIRDDLRKLQGSNGKPTIMFLCKELFEQTGEDHFTYQKIADTINLHLYGLLRELAATELWTRLFGEDDVFRKKKEILLQEINDILKDIGVENNCLVNDSIFGEDGVLEKLMKMQKIEEVDLKLLSVEIVSSAFRTHKRRLAKGELISPPNVSFNLIRNIEGDVYSQVKQMMFSGGR